MSTEAQMAVDAGVAIIQREFDQIKSVVSKATYHTCFATYERRLRCKDTVDPCRCLESCNHLSIVDIIVECLTAIDNYHLWPVLYKDFDYELDRYDD